MKIAICVPCGGGIKTQYLASLSRMLVWTGANKPEYEIEMFVSSGSCLPWLRERLTKQALAWGADWLLWTDADQTFPPDTLARLLSHDRPVVAVNCPHRELPIRPVAVKDGKRVMTDANSPPLEEVVWTGLAVALIRADVLRAIKPPLFGLTETIGEDCYFFAKLGIAGHPVVIDSRLSLEIGHVYETVLTLGETNARSVLSQAGDQ